MQDRRPLPSLTGVRTAAAAAVLLSHLRHLVPADPFLTVGSLHVDARQFLRQGNAGVSLFFLLSGFVLMWASRADDHPARFWVRRAARIYPAHLVVVAVWLALMAAALVHHVDRGSAIASTLLVQSWFPQGTYYFAGINPPTWSLAVEVFFYACFPAIAWALRRGGERAWRRTAWWSGAVALAVPIGCYVALDPPRDEYWSYVFPPARLAEFVLGASLALLVRAGRLRHVPVARAALVALVAYGLAGRLPRVLANAPLTLVPFVLVLLSAAGADLEGRASFWRHAALQHLGRISYGVFLVQWAVLELAQRRIDGGVTTTYLGALAVCGACTVVVVAVAEVLHHGVERPAERWIRRRYGGVDVGPPVAADGDPVIG